MSSPIDPAKLKVVDLRQELANRNLDTKGNKAALVKRLKDALETELEQEIPDTSIADTTTEDFDTSQVEDPESSKSDDEEPPEEVITKPVTPEKPKEQPKSLPPTPEKPAEKKESDSENPTETSESKVEENGDHEDKEKEDKPSDEAEKEGEDKPSEDVEMKEDGAQKGEKRKREGTSPSRAQRRRSKSPIKEDEPVIDNDKVQLSWYDSDLNLQLDKESFLSGKPLNEGAFGYIWAGARASHGVAVGKIRYEVKLTEELKYEDFQRNRNEKDRYRTDHRRDDKGRNRRDRKVSEKSAKKSEDDKDKKSESKEDKPETEKKPEETTEGKDASEEKMDTNESEPKESEEVKDAEAAEKEESKPEESSETKDEPKEESDDTKKPEESTEEKMETEEIKTEETKAEEAKPEEAKPEEAKPEEPPTEPIPERMFRVGFSMLTNSLQLGEEEHSFAYESSGKFATNKEFKDFGVKFGLNDVVGAFLSIDSDEVTFKFTVNGELQPETITVPKSDFPEENFALFPHVLSRNYAFEINLGQKEEPWFAAPEELAEYQFLDKVEEKVAGPVRFEARSDCEVYMMIGLPSSGKTHWVKEHVAANPDKKYTTIGNDAILERMTVSGETLKSRFKGRWPYLIERLQYCLNKMTDIASVRRRNYILDRPHVFLSQQRRKLRQFEGFKRHAVVVVVGDEEQARREALVEDKVKDDSAVLDMKATFTLPSKDDDYVDELTWAGVEEEEAKELIKKYNEAGKAAGYGKGPFNNRRNYYGNNNKDRGYQRYDRRHQSSNWGRQGSGGWNRDRRDNRGSDRSWGHRDGGRNDRSRDSDRSHGGYNRSRQGGNWGGSYGGQGNWQGYSGGYGQGGWGGQGGGGQNWKYGGQGHGGYGGGGGGSYGGNWNYYNQYSQSQNWNQKR